MRLSIGKIIIGVDSDVIIKDKNLFEKVAAKFSKNKKISALAFRIINNNSMIDDFQRWWHPLDIKENYKKEFISDYFSGTGYAIIKEDIEKTGLFPEDLFMHFEEVDLSLRIIDFGFNIMYCPSLIVYHNASLQSRNKKIQYYYKRRNQIFIVIKYYPLTKGLIYLIPRLVLTLFNSLKETLPSVEL